MMRLQVYCHFCHRISIVDVEPAQDANLRQYALDHNDHVVIFGVDSYGNIRSVHILKSFRLNKETTTETPAFDVDEDLDTFAIIENSRVLIGLKWDSDIVTLDVIPLIHETSSVKDTFSALLDAIGVEGVARLLLDIVVGDKVYVPQRGISEIVVEFFKTLLERDPTVIFDDARTYSQEAINYMMRIVSRIVEEETLHKRLYLAKKIVMTLRGIIRTILSLLDSEFGRLTIKDVFADSSRRELATLVGEVLRIKDPEKYRMFYEVIGYDK